MNPIMAILSNTVVSGFVEIFRGNGGAKKREQKSNPTHRLPL